MTNETIQIPIEILKLIDPNRETIKLEKNSRGYNWEIKLNIANLGDMATIDRLQAIDMELQKRYGSVTI